MTSDAEKVAVVVARLAIRAMIATEFDFPSWENNIFISAFGTRQGAPLNSTNMQSLENGTVAEERDILTQGFLSFYVGNKASNLITYPRGRLGHWSDFFICLHNVPVYIIAIIVIDRNYI